MGWCYRGIWRIRGDGSLLLPEALETGVRSGRYEFKNGAYPFGVCRDWHQKGRCD